MAKSNLSFTMTGEKIEYQRLYDLTGTAGRSMTTTGSYSFTSLSSGTTYSTTTGGEYAVFLQLQTALQNYDIIDTDFNNKVEVSTFNEHLADYTLQIPYAVDSSATAGVITVTLNPAPTSYVAGMAVTVKVANAVSGATTININGLGAIPVKKPNGTNPNFTAGGVYTLRYDGTNFTLQGSGGGGTATADKVLTGYTFTNDTAENISGTMPNKVGSGTVITPGTADIAIPQGYFGGVLTDGKVVGDANLIAANILSGKSIFGLAGTAKRTANGSVTASSGNLTVSTLPFSPSKVALVYIGVVNTNYGYLIVISSTQDIDGGNASLNYGLYVWNNNGTGYSQQITSQPMTANGFNFTNANIGGSWKYYAME